MERIRKVFEDQLVTCAGRFFVRGTIIMLAIDVRHIAALKAALEIPFRNVGGGFKRDMDALMTQRIAQRHDKVRLQKRLAAGERHASAAFIIKGLIL